MIKNIFKTDQRFFIRIILTLFLSAISLITFAIDQIDIGLYQTSTPVNTVQIKMRPNYSLLNQLSAFCYTIRWTDPSIVITTNYYSPYFIGPNDNGVPRKVTIDGKDYYYMVFNGVPSAYNGSQMNPGDEVLISSFSFTGGSCNTLNQFEIINDAWTQKENANVYFEVLGYNKTGIIYKPTVSFNAVPGTPSANQVICSGSSPSDITLTGSNGDIQWQESTDNSLFTNISGATSATLTASQMGSLTATSYYKALVSVGSCSVSSNVVTVQVSPTTNIWNGGTTDWNTPTNWNTGIVPLPCNDVIIPFSGISNFPIISVENAVCHDLTINPGAQLTLNDGKTLTAGGNLLIESNNATETGTFVDKNATGGLTITGTTTVQQFLTGSSLLARFPQWYVSSPVTGATSNTFNALSAENKLFYWTESALSFTEIIDNVTPLITGKGYIARMGVDETTVNFTGTGLNTGPVAVTGLTYTGTTHNNRSYNLVGNPYTSFLNWDNLWNLQSTLLQPTLFIRYADGSLHYYNAVNGASSNTSANTDIKTEFSPGIIAPLQSFWVEVIGVTSPGSEGSISFNNTNRSHQIQPANKLKVPGVSDNQQLLRLKVSNGIGSDETVVLFNENALDTYDFWDSHKMFTGVVPEIYTVTGDHKLAINGLKSVETNNVFPLGFRAGTANNYTLSLTELRNFVSGTVITLIDNGTLPVAETDLTTGSYSFNSNVADNTSRFTVIIKAPGTVTEVMNPEKGSRFVYSNVNRQVTIVCNEKMNKNSVAIVLNSLGQQICSKTLTGTVTVIESRLAPGIYHIKLNNGSKTTTEKLIIK